MTIVNSTYTLDKQEADGRWNVIELHTDHLGVVHRKWWRGTGDYANRLALHAAKIWQALIDNEIAAALRVDATPTLQYATKTDFIPVYRGAYRKASGAECARLAAWLLNRMDDGWATDTQVRNAFGLTAGEWTTLKAKMETLRSNWIAANGARGE